MENISNIVVFGGTGAQGSPVVKALAQDGKYNIRVQTRNPEHVNADELLSLPNVTFHKGQVESEQDLRASMQGMDAVYFLANGFAMGEKNELFWSFRAWEIAIQSGIKLFVFSALDYALKLGNYEEKYRCGHHDAKGRIAEWIESQPLSPMKWAILTSGPYMEMMSGMWAPTKEGETYVFGVPLQTGAIPMIHTADLGRYARWIFDHPDESVGKNLKISTQHVDFDQVAKAFEKVTGKKAVYRDVPLEQWFDGQVTEDASSAYQVKADEPGAMTWRKNFTGWWNMWRNSGGTNPIVSRDYALLDKILPDRVKTIEEWMIKTNYNGQYDNVLKTRKDKSGADRYRR